MKIRGYYIKIMCFGMLMLLSGCRKELCYNHFAAVGLSFGWEQEWERDYGMNHSDNWDETHHGFAYDALRPDVPEWVKLVRYADGGATSEKYMKIEGDNVVLNESDRSFLLYNGDTEYIILSDIASQNDARAAATGRSRSSIEHVMEKFPDSRSTNPPDVLYAAYVEEIPDAEMHQVTPLSVQMKPLVYTYHVRYEFESGLDYVVRGRGALAGMAESVYLRDGRTSEQTSIILYDCEMKSYGFEAQVRSFGAPGFPDEYYHRAAADEAGQQPYTLNLEVMMRNGKMKEFNIDISDQLRNQPRGGVITVTGLRVEEEEGLYESGFEVDVSGWGNHEDIELPVGGDQNN